jgi:F420-non-reducing hydrogenase iron-sulfur subunit
MALLKDILTTLGLETERVRIEWIGADEGRKFAKTVTEMTEQLREMGPNPMQKQWAL